MSHERDLSREALRREMRKRRRALSASERALASRHFRSIAVRARLFRSGLRVALYLPYGHEADCRSLIQLARARGCILYVPRILSYRKFAMRFVPHHPNASLRTNRHGIDEPLLGNVAPISIQQLDLVVLPAIAVDARGYRLGSGAGFYDRALQRLRAGRRWRKPKLIALTYDFQRVEHLTSHPWDVPVDAILTDKHLYRIPTDPHESLT
ncbi:MAG TPA: 5-formyltetrahydrofolate cyclo-ligase [Steroidobacteraceae bacterium]|nr:5-formyltetrahydrofolate cyclo-ligase [Steroidobacteraceae bacterium]